MGLTKPAVNIEINFVDYESWHLIFEHLTKTKSTKCAAC